MSDKNNFESISNSMHTFVKTVKAITIFCCLLFQPVWGQVVTTDHAAAALEPPAATIFDQMTTAQEVLSMTLMADFSSLIENRRQNEYLPASLSYMDALGQVSNWDLKIRLRGRFRRMKCDFPPLMLNFDKDDLKALGLAKHDKLKLVTHCMDDPQAEQRLLREWLCYQLYQDLTPNSYRAQLVRVTYRDLDGSMETIEQFGILLEDTDEMAERLGGKELEEMNQPDSLFDAESRFIQDLFQYMIANSDYDPKVLRNIKLVSAPYSDRPLTMVPYDFDFSGMVNAPYAIPKPGSGAQSVTDRIFLGERQSENVVNQVVNQFMQKQQQLFQRVDTAPFMDRASRRHARRMLETFFKLLADEDRVYEQFVVAKSTCTSSPERFRLR